MINQKALDVILDYKFGMISQGDIEPFDLMYQKMRDCAQKNGVLIRFGGDLQPAEKFYFKYKDNIVVFTLFKSLEPYYILEVIQNTHYPLLTYAHMTE